MIQTDRLILRELSHDDCDFIIELLNTEGWLQYIGDRNVHTHDQAIEYLNKGPIKSYLESGMGLYLVMNNQTKESMGLCGIFRRKLKDIPELGFAFLKKFEGMGYACESARACINDVQQRLAIDEICAITMEENTRSVRLLEKLGFTFQRKIMIDSDEIELLFYKT